MTGIYLGLVLIFILAFPKFILGAIITLIAFMFGVSF
tara:strand:- start:1077 stop:1187 length:111 start_codon:yes stop_codon:yes gene_type:complete